MRSHSAPSAFCRLSTTLYFALMFCTATVISSPAQSFTTLASFSGSNGIQPFSAMTQGPDGNVYGITQAGGNLSACGGSGCGTVFKVTPTGTLTVIYSFSGPDGDAPEALVLGSDGNFYGTTFCTPNGSLHHTVPSPQAAAGFCPGGGTIFKLSLNGVLTTLHAFSGGGAPFGVFTEGSDGNFYGTLRASGLYGFGTVFKITPTGTLTTLYNFAGPDGAYPNGVIQGVDGNFYGTTFGDQTDNQGTLFQITPSGMLTTIHSFNGPDGARPAGGLKQATDGTFYGVTAGGGVFNNCPNHDCGTVFKITSSGTLTTLHSFSGPDGSEPWAGLLLATDGNFYGTNDAQGVHGAGTAFRITPSGILTTVYNFCSESGCADGESPEGALLESSDGLVYGTTNIGGNTGTCDTPSGCGTVFSLSGVTPNPNQFVPVTPCRLVDTRSGNGGSRAIQGGRFAIFDVRQLSLTNGCGDLSSATAYSLNLTLIPKDHQNVSYVTMWPTGDNQPWVSTMNSPDGRTKASAAIVRAGAGGAVNIFPTGTTDVVLDINGYFAPPGSSTLTFHTLVPCRIADTRSSSYPQGLGGPYLSAGVARDFPLLNSSCIPTGVNVAAYSLNVTVVPYPNAGSSLGYLELWPTGEQPQNPVSTLNNPTGTTVANAAIVMAGTNGAITAYPSDETQLVIDINGYFSTDAGGLSLYPTVPCRAFDTRGIGNGQPFSGTLAPPVDVVGSPCGIPSAAQAYVFNATVVPSPTLNYLTLWPDGEGQPVVSTLNAVDGSITSNMAIVPNQNGKIDAYARGMTQLILDISSYFAP